MRKTLVLCMLMLFMAGILINGETMAWFTVETEPKPVTFKCGTVELAVDAPTLLFPAVKTSIAPGEDHLDGSVTAINGDGVLCPQASKELTAADSSQEYGLAGKDRESTCTSLYRRYRPSIFAAVKDRDNTGTGCCGPDCNGRPEHAVIGIPFIVSGGCAAPATYTVTADSSMTGGNLVLSLTSGVAGDTIIVTVNPDSGRQLVEGSLRYSADGGTTYSEITATDGMHSFLLPAADVMVTAAFEDILAPATYTVTADSSMTGGNFVLSLTSGAAGDTIIVTVNPDSGRQLVEGSLRYSADGGTTYSEITATDGVYSFLLPAADVMVTAVFEVVPSDLVVCDGLEGVS